MRILFATARPFFPELLGGAERSMQRLLAGLSQRGHDCLGIAVLANPGKSKALTLVRLVTGNRVRYLRDDLAGFRMRRTRSWMLDELFRETVRSFRPDVLVTQLLGAGAFADLAIKHGIRPVVLLRDMDAVPFNHAQACDGRITFVSNSQAVQRWARDTHAIDSRIVYPPIDISLYRKATNPKYVTFINPTRPKGLELAIGIARASPKTQFLFVESWPLGPAEYTELLSTLSELQNVTLWRRRSNVQDVYDVSRLLMVPSRWQEAFGRVVIEAQACGIPVVARNVGGISEAVGSGGILLSAGASSEEWAREIEALMGTSDGRYESLQIAALENARSGPWNVENAIDCLEHILSG